MALIVACWLITVFILVRQAIVTFRAGSVFWFCSAVPLGQSVSHGRQRTMYAFGYLFPAMILTMAMGRELGRLGVTALRQWLMENLALFMMASGFIVVGLLSLLRPDVVVRRTVRTAPELADNPSVQLIARVIGVVMIAGSLFILSQL